MKLRVFALDFDGTIAQNGLIDPDVKIAIAEARAQGVVVVLVTGRILADLKRLVGDLGIFDAVVGENGAVLSLPGSRSRLIGYPPPVMFLEELRRRKIAFGTGQCIVEAAADLSPQILSVIRELELPLVLLFNQDRVMVLPQGVSKGIGLREALDSFHLSVHNAIGIGNAENDHDLLTTCKIGVAVSWGSKALQKEADEVLQGDGPRAVAGYIRRKVGEMQLPHLSESVAEDR